jgi:uncharacterized protein
MSCVFLSCFWWNSVLAQSYIDSIKAYQRHYFDDLVKEERLPFELVDSNKINFFKINEEYRIAAKFKRIIDTVGFNILTHSGKQKKHFIYGSLSFKLQNKKQTLYIYQSASLSATEGYEDYLFLPFTDLTCGKESYGGGRYLDYKWSDIKDNKLVIDFNKAYNPYCAFGSGFNCPIPPKENFMKVKVRSGEKAFYKGEDEH